VSGSARPPLTVVIPTRDRPDHLRRCLDTLARVVGSEDEVIVVDSASTQPGPALVAAAAGARVVRADRPGTSLARNLGWGAATNDHIAFIDDDVFVDHGWADAMASALAVDGRTWVTGWIGIPEDQLHIPEPNPTMLVEHPMTLDAHRRGTLGASANMGARRTLLEEVGGFDVRFGPGTWVSAAEDVDLFDRFLLAGHVGFYDPSVRVYHDQWRTRRQAVSLHWRYGKGMGARLARLVRRDPARARRGAYEFLGPDGVFAAGRCLRVRYEMGAVFAMLRVMGAVAGFLARALRP
jgi:glycosyltransferase involved in cell wall biosynthesis